AQNTIAGRVEGAEQMSHQQDRFAQMAVVWVCFQITERFRVEQDRGDDSLHVAPHTRSVVRKGCRATADVRGRRVAGDQLMNQLRTEIRPRVLMIEEHVEGRSQLGRFVRLLLRSRGTWRIGNCTGREVYAKESLLIQVIAIDVVVEDHGIEIVRDYRGNAINHSGTTGRQSPTREQ